MKSTKKLVENIVLEHTELIGFLKTQKFVVQIDKVVCLLVSTVRNGNKILLCGNGGSAADCQHFAGELVGRFLMERKPIACIALTTNSSIITAIGNDYSFDRVFSRQIEATGNKEDTLILISTSGKSASIIDAAKTAKKTGIRTIGLTGSAPNPLSNIVDICVAVPSTSTPRIQEIHSIIIHILCHAIEQELFSHEVKKN
ncbi:MAG TPA: SIS domain-containing protein [bacterium]|nr:SIS domain-containing protein [bacterium]HOL49931.1 SIS domain-containing protein [bacterium]HPO51635.1 SIS domain-containing protein [bacterium]HXK44974.1 SIS domain-containing protein [bacterium]